MASENETVTEIVKRMDDRTNQLHLTAFNNATEDSLRVTLHNFILEVGDYAHEIEEAHGREVEKLNKRLEHVVEDSNRICGLCEPSKKILELRECLEEAVKDFCESCDDEDENGCSLCRKECRVNKWRKALEEANDEVEM